MVGRLPQDVYDYLYFNFIKSISFLFLLCFSLVFSKIIIYSFITETWG